MTPSWCPKHWHTVTRVGDAIDFHTAEGSRSFEVAATVRDYATDRGAVRMRQAVYARHWNDSQLTSLGVELSPDADPDEVQRRILQELPPGMQASVTTNEEIKRVSFEVFDRTFAVTRALRVIAIAVAFSGVLGALLALALDREREDAILRALGLIPSQLCGLVLLQGGLIGAIAGLLALPLGVAQALALILLINKRSFGWTLDAYIDPQQLLEAFALALTAALLAGVYPAIRMARRFAYTRLREL